MFKKKDIYSFTRYLPLVYGNKKKIGMVHLDYQVSLYDDVQTIDFSSVTRNPVRKYLLQCTQRINIYNPQSITVNPIPDTDSYQDYPLLVNTFINIDLAATGFNDFELLEYNPVTVNTKINTSSSNSDSTGTTNGSSVSSTVGSSTSQTNSFGISITASEMPSATESYDYSSTSSSDQSQTNASDSSRTRSDESSSSASMSVKDWGAYAFVNPVTKSPTWTFGQEYPWDVIQCRTSLHPVVKNPDNTNQIQLAITQAIQNRLYDQVLLYPPSQLSAFGINFVMKAVWLITLDDTTGNDDVTIDHTINYYTGSHMLLNEIPVVFMDLSPTIFSPGNNNLSTALNLPVMALDPLGFQNKPSITGFGANKFIIPPSPYTGTTGFLGFKIISSSNNLLVYDTTAYPSAGQPGGGFSVSQSALQASFTSTVSSLNLTISFKVVDTVSDYTLFIKHWITGTSIISLSVVINGDYTNVITKYVDASEGEGGQNNLLSISLRDQSYSSIDYHDYLQLGLNSIQITLSPLSNISAVPSNGYAIRAVSIEKV